jgi:hypothetical protein
MTAFCDGSAMARSPEGVTRLCGAPLLATAGTIEPSTVSPGAEISQPGDQHVGKKISSSFALRGDRPEF